MKQTASILVLLFASVAAHGATYTLTTDLRKADGTAATTNVGGYHAFTAAMGASFMTGNSELPTTTLLTQISINTATGTDSYAPSKVAVFECTADSGAGRIGTFVGISDNIVDRTAGTAAIFTFTDVVVDKSKVYTFAFVTEAANATNMATITSSTISSYRSAFRLGILQSDIGAVMYNGYEVGATASSNYSNIVDANLANVEYTLKDIPAAAIPEPATATLSLLALAGLCVRRRRK